MICIDLDAFSFLFSFKSRYSILFSRIFELATKSQGSLVQKLNAMKTKHNFKNGMQIQMYFSLCRNNEFRLQLAEEGTLHIRFEQRLLFVETVCSCLEINVFVVITVSRSKNVTRFRFEFVRCVFDNFWGKGTCILAQWKVVFESANVLFCFV